MSEDRAVVPDVAKLVLQLRATQSAIQKWLIGESWKVSLDLVDSAAALSIADGADLIERQAAECAALREDKRRLDWIELMIRDGSYATFINDIIFATQQAHKVFGKGPSLRSIIDGFMDQAASLGVAGRVKE